LLPPLVADAVREALQVALPKALPVPWHGATFDERAVLLQRGWQEAPRYQVGTLDRIDPFVRDAFELLAHPHVSVELVVGDVRARRDESAIAVTDGGFAVMARYDERGLMLEAVRPTGLASALVGLLPAHPPGRGHSASAPTEVLARAAARVSTSVGADPAALEREITAGGVRRQDAEIISGVLTAPRLRTGQLCAIGYEQHGGKGHAVELQIGFLDTETGRYLTQDQPSENGGSHLTIAPADTGRLVERIDELMRLAYELRG
jgi:EspG family